MTFKSPRMKYFKNPPWNEEHTVLAILSCVLFCLLQEIDKDKDELKHMRRDMMKMAREHGKLQIKLKDLVEFERTKKLLAALAKYVSLLTNLTFFSFWFW